MRNMNTLFPAFLNLDHKLCVVIGGGEVAFRKIRGLLQCHADVRVVSPSSIPKIIELQRDKKILLCERAYQSEDITGAYLVVAATNDQEANRRIFQDCEARQIFCNVVDVPELCQFYYAAQYTCGDLKIAISTNGASPALAKTLKTELAERYPCEFADYLDYLRRIRDAIQTMISEESERKTLLQKIVNDPSLREQCQHEPFRSQIAHLDYEREVEKWR